MYSYGWVRVSLQSCPLHVPYINLVLTLCISNVNNINFSSSPQFMKQNLRQWLDNLPLSRNAERTVRKIPMVGSGEELKEQREEGKQIKCFITKCQNIVTKLTPFILYFSNWKQSWEIIYRIFQICVKVSSPELDGRSAGVQVPDA